MTWAPTPPAGHPVNYFVPDFGTDENISASLKNTADTEALLAHKWIIPEKKDDPAPYIPPVIGVDEDIRDSLQSLKGMEDLHGPWNVEQDDNGYWVVP